MLASDFKFQIFALFVNILKIWGNYTKNIYSRTHPDRFNMFKFPVIGLWNDFIISIREEITDFIAGKYTLVKPVMC